VNPPFLQQATLKMQGGVPELDIKSKKGGEATQGI